MSNLSQIFYCVNCGNDGVQAVKALYSPGVWNSKTEGYSVGGAYVPGHSHRGHYHPGHTIPVMTKNVAYQSGSTELARLLAPPVQPARKSSAVSVMFVIFLLLTWLFVPIGLLASGCDATMLFLATVSVLLVILLGVASHQVKEAATDDFSWQMSDWNKKMAVWSRLLYCPRCDHVSDTAKQLAFQRS